MANAVLMPKLGLTMTEGVVDEWSKKEGDSVSKGEVVCSISSEKLTQDIEAEQDGVLLKIVVPTGGTAKCTAPIGYIGQAGESLPAGIAAHSSVVSQAHTDAPVAAHKVVAVPAVVATRGGSHRIFISKLAKKIALDKGLDYSLITGTGGNGRITKRDVEKYVATAHLTSANAVSNLASAGVGLSGMRRIIAKNMMNSLHSTAQLTLNRKADVTQLMQFRTELKAKLVGTAGHDALSLNVLLMKAVALALRDVPQMNCHYDGQQLQPMSDINIGVAVALDEGLVVPAIANVADKTLSQLARDFKAAVTKVREGNYETGVAGTFTITNLGSESIEYFTPIINTPEVGILGVGALQSRLYLDKAGVVQEARELPLSLTFDHQVIDGAPAAHFLSVVVHYLANPYLLLV